MSTLVGSIVIQVQSQYPEASGPEIAGSVAIICGGIVTFLGLFGLGFIVDFIPLPAISAFMTGSALNICSGQVSTMLGETAKFDTKGATYEIIINTLKYLPTSTIDAAVGVTAMAMLYIIRSACNYGAKKNPRRANIFFFLSTLRTVFVILFYIMIGAAVNLHRENHLFTLLGHIPRGKLIRTQKGSLLTWPRFSGCRCTEDGAQVHRFIRLATSCCCDCPPYRAHCHFQVIWPSQ